MKIKNVFFTILFNYVILLNLSKNSLKNQNVYILYYLL